VPRRRTVAVGALSVRNAAIDRLARVSVTTSTTETGEDHH
jgi:hypothetical protein